MTRRLGLAGFLALATAVPLQAQARGSQANLVFGVAAGRSTGRVALWAVGRQGIPYANADPLPQPADTVAVARDIDGGFGLMFYGMYFPSETFGFNGEVQFLGTQYADRCSTVAMTTPIGGEPNINRLGCEGIDGNELSTSTVLATVGVVARAWARETISPYLRLGGGLGIISRSAIDMTNSRNTTLVRVYDTGEGSSLTLSALGAAGITARLGRGGYQIRTEVRDNLVGYRAVTGATPAGILEPPTKVRYKHIISIVLGFEIVLERSRGRRY